MAPPAPRGRGAIINIASHCTGSGDSITKSTTKTYSIKCCARPSSMEHSNARWGSDSLIGAQSSWPPPILTAAKLPKKKMGAGVRPVRNLPFVPNFAKPGRNQRPKTGKCKFYFFVLFEPFFFASFLPLFLPFFALIRVTLGFFVVFPNKSHTLIRVTFGVK